MRFRDIAHNISMYCINGMNVIVDNHSFILLLDLEMVPFTLSAAILDTVPYLLLAVQVNIPESSGKTSAMTKVHISSKGKTRKVIVT